MNIVFKHVFTLFNFVNVVLAVMVAMTGSYRHMLFIVVAIANTLIGIINEWRAKRVVDKMRVVSEKKPKVLRDEKIIEIEPAKVVVGDLIKLGLGDQIIFDSIVEEGSIEVNEAFITGEQDTIVKNAGDEIISGSFVVAGSAIARVRYVLADNFINKLEKSAKEIKPAGSKLFIIINNIVKYVSIVIIPVGLLLFWRRYSVEASTNDAIISTVAALISMIPEGLVLLTSSALALSTIRLSKKSVLVHDLYSIETLARVNCICLDKTGTITTGKMEVVDIINCDGDAKKSLQKILAHIPADTATSAAIKNKLIEDGYEFKKEDDVEIIPFSSERKYSGIKIKGTEYLMGAAEFLTENDNFLKKAKEIGGGFRILTIIRRKNNTEELLGFVRLKDEVRSDAREIINYFYDNDIEIKIISGDDKDAVLAITKAVGVRDLHAVDLSLMERINYGKIVRDYNIFTRVKPGEKQKLIKALRKQGKTVAMTGDGVNDILAMKEADCSIAIGEGADAARRAAKLVLLGSDFGAVPSIIDEGRQTVNNLERSATLFLTKTVYACILAIVFVIMPLVYPFIPIEMSLLNFICIGAPAFVMAFEKNTMRIRDNFVRNIVRFSVPAGLTVAISMLGLSILNEFLVFTRTELTTLSAIVTFLIDFVLIVRISRPLSKMRLAVVLAVLGVFASVLMLPFLREFFGFVVLDFNKIILAAIFGVVALFVFWLAQMGVKKWGIK